MRVVPAPGVKNQREWRPVALRNALKQVGDSHRRATVV